MKRTIKLEITIFICLLLAGSNLFSAEIISSEKNSDSTLQNTSEDSIYACGAYPLPDTVTPSTPTQNFQDSPSHFDWRDATYQGKTGNWVTSIKKQGECGSCWAFAAIGAIEAMVNIQKNNPSIDLDLSEQHLVSCCSYGCNGCHGGSSYYAWDYLKNNNGAILESYFPYEGIDSNGCYSWKNDDCSKDPILCDMKSDNWDDFTVPIKSKGYYQSDFSLIKDTVVNHGPVVTFMMIYSDFNYYSGGIYEKTGNPDFLGGHAVMIVGYDEDENYLICKNSWGKNWGEDGYFRIPYGECMIGEQIYFVEIDEEKCNFPPIACASGPYEGEINENIYFKEESIDQDNNIINYYWDFGDGTTSTDKNPIYSYNQKGIYTVTLTVTDSQGAQDLDETAVFIDMWDVNDYWIYNISFETVPDAFYPPIRIPGEGKIDELTLTVIEEHDKEYILEVSGILKGNILLHFDIQKSLFDFRLWGKVRRGRIDGIFTIDKKGFGIIDYNLNLHGFANLYSLPIVPIPLWIPLPFDISMKKTYNESRPLITIAPEVGKSWEIPSSNSSNEMDISLFFGLISNSFKNSEIVANSIYHCTEQKNINIPSGQFDSYKFIIESSYKNYEFFYSPLVRNIVKFTGGDIELFSISGNLISTNV